MGSKNLITYDQLNLSSDKIRGEDEARFAENNKLQASKSSFQAWKCVSFGCSLLAVVMLASKFYEVSTDLNLLLGINRLLTSQQVSAQNSTNSNSNNSSNNNNNSISWPPIPIELILPAANESNLGIESMESNETMLMSHLQMSLSQELNGDQLLRQEVDVFVVEFKNAKSTLGLSSLLVSVYIVSWILMTFAINDTRISNDISLRNILLLSVFGAVDIAASAGFVLIRLIMYSVKNNSFASEMLNSVGLIDTPVRLSADQLTAFTALRLIGMRSCSAYVDVYVSVILVFLTILRLYAVLRAITYYRRLRRLTDANKSHQIQAAKQQVWSTFYTTNDGHFQPMISQQQQQQQQQQQHLQESAVQELTNQQKVTDLLRLPLGYHGNDNQVYLTKYERSPEDELLDVAQLPNKQFRPQTLPRLVEPQIHKSVARTLNVEQQAPPVMILPQSAYSTFRGAQTVHGRGKSGKRPQSNADLLLIPGHHSTRLSKLVLSEPEYESEPVRPRTRQRQTVDAASVEQLGAVSGEYRLLEERNTNDTIGRRLLLATEPERSRVSGQKYRLVAARLKRLPKAEADADALATASRTSNRLVERENSSSSSSSGNTEDSDGSGQQLTRPKQAIVADRLTGLRESEEVVTGSLRRHKVYEVFSGSNKRPSSLVSKYYYA